MVDVILQMALYLAAAAALGLILGFLIWGWGRRAALEAARAEGAMSARTSVDGDSALHQQLKTAIEERKRLELMVDRQRDRIRRLEDALAKRGETAPHTAGTMPGAADADRHRAATPAEEPITDFAGLMRARAGAAGGRPAAARAAAAPAAPDPVGPDMDAPDAAAPDAAVADPAASAAAAAPAEVPAEMPGNVRPLFAAPAEPAPPAPDEDAAAVPDIFAAEAAETAPVPPSGLLSAPPAMADDLKRIRGIGPVMERVLNDVGIYHYHQIARLTPDQVAWLTDAVEGAPDRVERDGWIAQAQAMLDGDAPRAAPQRDG